MPSSLRHLATDVLYKPVAYETWLRWKANVVLEQGQDPESHWRTFYSPSVQRGILMQIAEIATAEGGSPYTKNTGEEPSLYQRDDTLGGEGSVHPKSIMSTLFSPALGSIRQSVGLALRRLYLAPAEPSFEAVSE